MDAWIKYGLFIALIVYGVVSMERNIKNKELDKLNKKRKKSKKKKNLWG